MKRTFTPLPGYSFTAILLLFSVTGYTQLNNSGFHARFGVDADTRTDYIKYGVVTGAVESDDWFSGGGASIGVIDTTNAELYRSNLVAGNNISFSRRMSVPLYYKANNTMWLDAIYSRDYVKKDSINVDRTAYVSSAGNLDDPATWKGGSSDVSTKTDLVDVFAHMRRSGTTIKDSLWLFTAVSTIGTNGARYFDVELYKNRLSYNPMSGVFSSGGPDEGHSQWKFDAAGNVIQTGDMIIGVTYSPGSAPVIEVRIWVAKSTFNTAVPALFNFGSNFDAFSNKSTYGYGNIVSKNGSTAFGSGVGNYSVTSSDTTFSTPWGTTTNKWSQEYQSLQLVEIGINLSRIGVDPSLYTTLGVSACGAFFKSILFKSRSSGSFSSNLNDFAGPLDFLNIPTLDYSLTGDTLSCRQPTGILNISSKTTAGAYTWKALNGGNVTDANADSSSLTIDKPGKYVIYGAVATGCPIARRDTITVLADSLKPVATAKVVGDMTGHAQLFGGDTLASNYSTPFGGSKGLTWSWTGPNGFTSSSQNPYIDNNWGNYQLTVTEKRNGCISMASVFANFSLLYANPIQLAASRTGSSVQLNWRVCGNAPVAEYVVEKAAGNAFVQIGKVQAINLISNYSFTDRNASPDKHSYRVGAIGKDGSICYSNLVNMNAGMPADIYLKTGGISNSLQLMTRSAASRKVTVSITSTAGALLSVQNVVLSNGHADVKLPGSKLVSNEVVVIAVFSDNKLIFSQKIKW